MFSNPNRSCIQEHAVKVYEQVIARKDVISVITMERGLDGYPLPAVPE